MNSYIKIKAVIVVLFTATLFLFSCTSSKDLVFLNDMPQGQKVERLSEEFTRHHIIAGDMLYVSIKSINPEVTAAFDPESGGQSQSGNSYQKYTNPAGAYLYGFEVSTKGVIRLPILGEILVAGLSQQEAEILVRQKANEYIKDAIVKVKMLNFKVTILGEVRSPGVYYNYNNTFTVLEALAKANGNTDYANIKKIMVVRPGAEGNISYMLDLSSKQSYLSEGFYLHPNDYIFVHPNKRKYIMLNGQALSVILSSLSALIAVLAFTLR